MSAKLHESGFTVIELLAIIATSSIIIGTMTAFALNLWTNTAVVQSDQETFVSRLNAGDYLRNSINSAVGLINQNDLSDPHAGKPDPADPSGVYWIPIHAVPGTINMGAPGTITPVVYFNRPSVDTSSNIIMNGTVPYQDDIILYMDGTTKQLLSRIVANPYATDNRAKTTCPASAASQSCPKDTVIADDVSGVDMRYFSRSGNAIDYESIVDPITGAYIGPDFPSVEVVEFNLKLHRKARLHSGADTINQAIIRIALRN
jgi:hypothetical protein